MKFSVAPMQDWTDTHCRYFHRLISKYTTLYTEMIVDKSILFGNKEKILKFNNKEEPLILQLGGNDPQELLESTKIAIDFGYKSINLNIGCPSNKVKKGNFGASLMKNPYLVADCINTLKSNTKLVDISIKHRIGVDDIDSYKQLSNFIKIINQAGCSTFIIHARKALLNGISPKKNRTIPPINYQMVYDIKKDFPQLNIIINGQITTIEQSKIHLKKVDGVMLGRAIYHNPYLLSTVDNKIYNKNNTIITRDEVLINYIKYIEENIKNGVAIKSMTRHILGLYYGQKYSKKFKQLLSKKIVLVKDLKEFIDGIT